MEQWVNIPWTNDVYAASSEGRIKSNNCPRKDGRVCRETILRTWIGNHGYQTVALRVDGRYKRCTVHSLVAECFLGVKPEGTEIDHIDGNKMNNSATNLQYITRKQNIIKYYQQGYTEEKKIHKREIASIIGRGAIRMALGKPVNRYTLDNEYIDTFNSISEASETVSGKRSNGRNIVQCCNGQCKQSYGYHWKWAEKSVTTSSNERKEKGENPSSEVQDINDIV